MFFRPFILRLAPTVLFTCSFLLVGAEIGSTQQSPPPGGGGRGMRPHGERSQSFDPVVFQGPPMPDSMATLVGLDAGGVARYATMYQNLMTSTKSERDSLASIRQARRASRENGVGPQERGGPGGMREIRQYLEDRQKQFDQALGDVLSKEQLKRYQNWREQRRRQAQSEMRDGRDSGNGQADNRPGQ
jgi:hypothetical protein